MTDTATVSGPTTTPKLPRTRKPRRIRQDDPKFDPKPRKPRVAKPVMVLTVTSPPADELPIFQRVNFDNGHTATTAASAAKAIREHGIDGNEYLVVRVLLRKRLKRVQMFKNTLE